MKHTYFTNIFVVAKNTFKESVRDKVFYALFAFAFIAITFTIFLGSISLDESLHIVRSLGLAGIYLCGLLITIFLGTSLMYKEIERRTLYFILSKPISHRQVIVGKFLGLFGSVALSIIGMAIVYLGVVAYSGGGFDRLGLLAIFFEILEIGLLIALSIFFSTFSKPLPSMVYALLVIYIGHSLEMLVDFTKRGSVLAHNFAQGLYYVLPTLEKFNIRDLVLYNGAPSFAATLLVITYAAFYTIILLAAGSLLLQKRAF